MWISHKIKFLLFLFFFLEREREREAKKHFSTKRFFYASSQNAQNFLFLFPRNVTLLFLLSLSLSEAKKFFTRRHFF